MEGPIGELTWLNVITLFAPSALPGFHDDIDWSEFPDFPRDADEWALWQCLDEDGQPWTRVGDARVVRAAWPVPAAIPGRGLKAQVERNWWVDSVPQSAFPGLLPGWFDRG